MVPGDIVEVKGGDRIPADIRIIYSQEMKVDNSSLTGESDALLRTVECTNKDNPLETNNLAFFGTLCKEGIGRGVVIQIGDRTVIGQIANLASTAATTLTPLRRELNRFIAIVATIAITEGVILFVMGFILGYPPITNLIFGIGIIVANVPEGLLATVTVALTLTAKALSKKKVLVKNLEAVETLGSTSCICSDKTGTLTQNRMTVEHLWYDGQVFKGENYEKKGSSHQYEYDMNSPGFKTLHENAILSSEATFNTAPPQELFESLEKIKNDSEKETKRQQIIAQYQKDLENTQWLDRATIGDASESAIIKFFQPIQDIQATREQYLIRKMKDGSMGRIPFNSSWKYALVICKYEIPGSVNCIFIKGAPEKIWSLCSDVAVNGKSVPIDSEWQKKFADVNKQFGNGGERVLGFAKLHLPADKYPADYQFDCKNPFEPNYPMKGFTFTGLVSLIDPPREAVPYSILKCKTAGIKVIMVTGDQPVTAAAIARQVNIFGKNEKTVNQIMEEENISFEEAFERSDALVVHGDMITAATREDELLPENERGKTIQKWLSKPRIVFARTTPAQKLIIVEACQKQGHVVAVTGDGVNDSPAIKKADIGIAMGITGSDVAKDAADMILLTDDFAAIVLGVEEGRKIFDNLRKSILYCLSSNMPELFPFLSLIILRFPLPLSTILVLCIDLGTDILPAMALSSEDSELGIMIRPPRKKTNHLVTAKLVTAGYGIVGVFQSLAGFLTYFIVMYDFGFAIDGLIGLAIQDGFSPGPGTVFDPTLPYYGQNSNKFINYCNNCWNGTGTCDPGELNESDADGPPDWLFYENEEDDLRLYFLQCTQDGGFAWPTDWETCFVKQVSGQSDLPVCYTTEALKFAQTAFFCSIALCQLVNIFVVKTRTQSFMFSGLRNFNLIFGLSMEVILCLFLAYFPPFNVGLGTREIIFLHFGWPAVPFAIFQLMYDETRKYLIRNIPKKDSKPNWFERNTWW